MLLLALAGFAFLALHIVPATPARGRLIGTLGEQGYLGTYSLFSLTIFVLWTRAFAATPVDAPLWAFPDWWPWVKAVILLFAAVLFVASVSMRASVGNGIFAITRHPGLWSFGLWGAAHLISQPNLRGLLFFGLFALLAFSGMFLLDMRKAAASPESWQRIAATTSRLPFLAMAQGRATLQLAALGWWRVALAVAIWATVLHFHKWLFSVSPLPGLM